ncbi:hypothetical protein I5Q34_19535 [Streptomyces sp. AV19]|uniref:hypothetical protein n=1 Tax=Streptomyces sp. AV19 TaxID=2793068 RepID=UPI0018FE3999|nr:hypothetical protein [Streptomyces sp. AV19]MBH1936441.1 hypothetical protein [Streptomyces sp. AV19]MDG4532492.1 hypothetical protein [Streptomyces sp. AV19]
MTSRTPRDSRLRLVPRQPIAAARKAVADRGSRPAPRPPAGIPGRPELARQARAGLTGAVRLARWAAEAETRPEELGRAADRAAAALGVTPDRVRADWDRARLAGLLELHGGTARPGWRLTAWDRDDSAVLRGWVALFDAWSIARPEPAGTDATVAAEVVEAAPQLLSVMHLSAGPVPVAELLDLLRQRVAEIRAERCEVRYEGRDEGRPVPDRPTRCPEAVEPLAGLLDWALDGLASVGALVVRGTGPTAEAVLTPLGNWAVWVKLEQICVAAQSPAGNIELAAEAMLRGCADLSPGPARAEYRAWLAARPVRSAVAELLDAARGDDALVRGLAFEALRAVGAPAEPAVRAAVDEPAVRPYALLWLAEQEGHDPEEAAEVLTREEATWLWVDTAAAVADHGESRLLVRHLDSAVQGTVPGLLEEVRAVGHPRTVQVLVALAAAHPDPALAKAVRRAAFQVHRGGT